MNFVTTGVKHYCTTLYFIYIYIHIPVSACIYSASCRLMPGKEKEVQAAAATQANITKAGPHTCSLGFTGYLPGLSHLMVPI